MIDDDDDDNNNSNHSIGDVRCEPGTFRIQARSLFAWVDFFHLEPVTVPQTTSSSCQKRTWRQPEYVVKLS
jgi:hypothetical protein